MLEVRELRAIAARLKPDGPMPGELRGFVSLTQPGHFKLRLKRLITVLEAWHASDRGAA